MRIPKAYLSLPEELVVNDTLLIDRMEEAVCKYLDVTRDKIEFIKPIIYNKEERQDLKQNYNELWFLGKLLQYASKAKYYVYFTFKVNDEEHIEYRDKIVLDAINKYELQIIPIKLSN